MTVSHVRLPLNLHLSGKRAGTPELDLKHLLMTHSRFLRGWLLKAKRYSQNQSEELAGQRYL